VLPRVCQRHWLRHHQRWRLLLRDAPRRLWPRHLLLLHLLWLLLREWLQAPGAPELHLALLLQHQVPVLNGRVHRLTAQPGILHQLRQLIGRRVRVVRVLLLLLPPRMVSCRLQLIVPAGCS
jgi:hypothetical protein